MQKNRLTLTIYTSLLLLLLPINLTGQRQNEVWLFGLGAGLDFSTGVPTKIENGLMFSKEGCANICDENGQLLFYTNGIKVWNKNHLVMPNGNGLKGGASTSSTNQALIVPFPSNPGLYFILTTDERGGSKGLNYSLVDMTLQDGKGDVVQKNILLYTPTTERLALARHSNGQDFWLITHGWQNKDFITFLIDKNGINDIPIRNSIGVSHQTKNTSNLNARGMMVFNSTFSKMAVAVYKDNIIQVFNFDNCTGTISNPITTKQIETPYGLAFSPNDQWLYVTNLDGELYQLNALAATQSALDNSVNLVGSTSYSHLGAIQEAIDGKLYIAIPNAPQLGVIHAPNLAGNNCQYQDLAIDLGIGTSGEGLPQRLPFFKNSTAANHYLDAKIIATDGCTGEPVPLSIQTTEVVNQIDWTLGIELTSENRMATGITTTQFFQDTGVIQIAAILSNTCKVDTLYKKIHIGACDFPFFVPNAFSPNQDGENDDFGAEGALSEIESYEMVIFSRWGDMVFRSTNPLERWQGDFRGKKANEGVFVWMIKVKFLGLKEVKIFSGDITLFK